MSFCELTKKKNRKVVVKGKFVAPLAMRADDQYFQKNKICFYIHYIHFSQNPFVYWCFAGVCSGVGSVGRTFTPNYDFERLNL